MAKKVILAVAGAGKTYHICHNLDENKRNLILAFTHENINNIRRELFDAKGRIPKNTTVSTFDSFVYNHFILPYEYTIGEFFGNSDFKSAGITTVSPPPPAIESKKGNYRRNRYYPSKKYLAHYITKDLQYYCETLSELAIQVKDRNINLIKRAIHRLSIFYDKILIDEFQDFRQFDYDLLLQLCKYFPDTVLVGDFYQHSVSATNNSGKPFNKSNTINSFVESLEKIGFEVDQHSLSQSRRCSTEICNYIKGKFDIPITSAGINKGELIWGDEFASEILADDNVLKLVYSRAAQYKFNAMNWSYSKGSTFNKVCVILTSKFENLDSDSFNYSNTSPITVNKLYVALTRSSGNLYLIKQSTFKRICNHI